MKVGSQEFEKATVSLNLGRTDPYSGFRELFGGGTGEVCSMYIN